MKCSFRAAFEKKGYSYLPDPSTLHLDNAFDYFSIPSTRRDLDDDQSTALFKLVPLLNPQHSPPASIQHPIHNVLRSSPTPTLPTHPSTTNYLPTSQHMPQLRILPPQIHQRQKQNAPRRRSARLFRLCLLARPRPHLVPWDPVPGGAFVRFHWL